MNLEKYGSNVQYLRPDQVTRVPGCIEDLAAIHTGMTYLVQDARSYSKDMVWKLCHMAKPLVIPCDKNSYACIGNTQTLVIAASLFGWSQAIPMEVVRRLSDTEIREFALTEMGRTVGCAIDPVGTQLNEFFNYMPERDRLWIFPATESRSDFADIVGRDEKTLRVKGEQVTAGAHESSPGLDLPGLKKKVSA